MEIRISNVNLQQNSKNIAVAWNSKTAQPLE